MNARWVDLQINGYAGVDFNAPGLTPEAAVRAVTERLAPRRRGDECRHRLHRRHHDCRDLRFREE